MKTWKDRTTLIEFTHFELHRLSDFMEKYATDEEMQKFARTHEEAARVAKEFRSLTIGLRNLA